MPPQSVEEVTLKDYRNKKKTDTIATNAMDAIFADCGQIPGNGALKEPWDDLVNGGLNRDFFLKYKALFGTPEEAENMANWPAPQLNKLGKHIVSTCEHAANTGEERAVKFKWFMDETLQQEFIHCMCDSGGYLIEVHLMSPDDPAHVVQDPATKKWSVKVNPK